MHLHGLIASDNEVSNFSRSGKMRENKIKIGSDLESSVPGKRASYSYRWSCSLLPLLEVEQAGDWSPQCSFESYQNRDQRVRGIATKSHQGPMSHHCFPFFPGPGATDAHVSACLACQSPMTSGRREAASSGLDLRVQTRPLGLSQLSPSIA